MVERHLEDGNKAAKVVAYDSQATENTEMIAMLLSPRLDFKNAQERLLCFNVMGRMMTEGMNDYLMVAVIDALEADTNPENVTVSGIDASASPAPPTRTTSGHAMSSTLTRGTFPTSSTSRLSSSRSAARKAPRSISSTTSPGAAPTCLSSALATRSCR